MAKLSYVSDVSIRRKNFQAAALNVANMLVEGYQANLEFDKAQKKRQSNTGTSSHKARLEPQEP